MELSKDMKRWYLFYKEQYTKSQRPADQISHSIGDRLLNKLK